MKTVILLGAISPFCDLVKEIADLGIEPVICDYYTDAPAKKMGYRSYNISTMNTESIKQLAIENRADGVISAFSDRNLIPALDVCEAIGSNYYFSRDIIDCLTNKQKMKKFFVDNGFPVIKYGVHKIDELKKCLSSYEFPVVTKPMDAYGSKGIFICNGPDEVFDAFHKTVRSSLNYLDTVIIEEFYRADEISVSAWVKDGIAYITCIYDVFRNTGDGISLSAVSFPSKYSYSQLGMLDKLLNKMIRAINIKEGPVTLQCFIGKNGIKVSELLCRLAGGSPYLYATYLGGPDLARMFIQHSAGEAVDYQNLTEFKPLSQENTVYYDIQILISHKGVIRYELDEEAVRKEIPEIVDLRVYYPDGSVLENADRSGVQFAKVICSLQRKDDYYGFIKLLNDAINVFNEAGEKISFIRKPERLNVCDQYSVNWDFLDGE